LAAYELLLQQMAAFRSLMLAELEASVGLHQVATFAAAATA
jgi:hypothetical protein